MPNFLRISRLQNDELSTLEESLRTPLGQLAPPALPVPHAATRMEMLARCSRHVPRLRYGQEAAFRALWGQNIPVVVEGIQVRGDWTPRYFVESHGSMSVTMISHADGPKKTTVRQFFEQFTTSDKARKDVIKVKVCRTISPSYLGDNIDVFRTGRHLRSFLNSFPNTSRHSWTLSLCPLTRVTMGS